MPLLGGGGEAIERKGFLVGLRGVGETPLLFELRPLLQERMNAVDVLGALKTKRGGLVARGLLESLLKSLPRRVLFAGRERFLPGQKRIAHKNLQHLLGLLQLREPAVEHLLRSGEITVGHQLAPRTRRLEGRLQAAGREGARHLEILDPEQNRVVPLPRLTLGLHVARESVDVLVERLEDREGPRELVRLDERLALGEGLLHHNQLFQLRGMVGRHAPQFLQGLGSQLEGLLGLGPADERRTSPLHRRGRRRGLRRPRLEYRRAPDQLDPADHQSGGKQQPEGAARRPRRDARPRPAPTHLLFASIGVPMNDPAFPARVDFVFLGHGVVGMTFWLRDG